MADLIAQLKAPDPAKRRAAINQLVNAGDSNAVDILKRMAATDPDAAVRDLAEQGAGRLQVKAWRRTQNELQRVSAPDEIEPSKKEAAQRTGHAQSSLHMAVHHYTANEHDAARRALSAALITDPGLASDRDARRLASALLAIPDPGPAIQALQAQIAEELEASKTPRADTEGLRFLGLVIGLAVALLLVFAVLYRIYDHDLVSIVSYTTFGGRLSAFFRALNPSSVARAFLPALLLLVALVVGNVVMYLLSTAWLGSIVSMPRFISAVMIAQLLVIALGLLCLLFMPITTIVTVPGPNGTAVNVAAVNSSIVAFGLFWVLLLQCYAVARLAGVPLPKGAAVVVIGFIAFYLLARLLIGFALAGVPR